MTPLVPGAGSAELLAFPDGIPVPGSGSQVDLGCGPALSAAVAAGFVSAVLQQGWRAGAVEIIRAIHNSRDEAIGVPRFGRAVEALRRIEDERPFKGAG